MKNFFLYLCISITTWNFSQETVEFMDPNDIQKGMKGYALTVFQGLEPERMDLEVITYMRNRFPKAGMILVKLSGENVERSRVAAGMSGSPVYIDGKLVGALAYTWEFARELMAGIVPIQDMISDKERGASVGFIPQGAIPIKTAWNLYGIDSPDLLEELQALSDSSPSLARGGLEKFMKVPSSRSNSIIPLKGGDGVAISLVDGDINLASIGTVTYVDGEDVYIYGHPMDGDGPVSLPMARAEIYGIMSSTQLSFKLGSALPEIVGSTVFDGLSSVYGRFDIKAEMSPVTINFVNNSKTNSYNFRVARSKKYLPLLLGSLVSRVLNREVGNNIEKQVSMSWNLQFTNNVSISNQVNWVKNTIYDPVSIGAYWESYISVLWNNTLGHLVPTNIVINVDLGEKPFNYYMIDSVKSDSEQYFSGDEVNFQIGMSQYLNPSTFFTNLSVQLPKNLKEGVYTVMVGGALNLQTELQRQFPEFYQIRNFQALIDELKKPIETHKLYAVIIDTKNGSIIGNSFLTKIPLTRQSLFENKSFEGKNILAPSLMETELLLDQPVIGGRIQKIYITVPDPIIL